MDLKSNYQLRKIHILEVECSILFKCFAEDYSPENQPSIPLSHCSKEVREEPGYMGVLDGKKAVVK